MKFHSFYQWESPPHHGKNQETSIQYVRQRQSQGSKDDIGSPRYSVVMAFTTRPNQVNIFLLPDKTFLGLLLLHVGLSFIINLSTSTEDFQTFRANIWVYPIIL